MAHYHEFGSFGFVFFFFFFFFYNTCSVNLGNVEGRLKWRKIANALNDLRMTLTHLTVKSTLYTLDTYTGGPNFHPFRPTIVERNGVKFGSYGH